jgi:endonuclease/exonuclease/phosphatase family metal-dependent hydrolase
MTHTLRLCTWNIQMGRRLDHLLLLLAQHTDFDGLDLLALQEASEHGHRTDAYRFARALGPQYEYLQVTAHVLRGQAQANALIWNSRRIQIDAHHVLGLPHHGEVTLPRAEHALLRALPRQKRNSLVVEGRVGGESLRIYVVHLDVVGFTHKREQFASVLSDAGKRSAVDTTLIAGDLNTFGTGKRPSWAPLRAAAAGERFEDLTKAIRWTQAVRSLHLRQKLDAVFARQTRPAHHRAWTLDVHGSDHIPVFVELDAR